VEEEEVEEVFTIVEEGAEPVGGYEEFYKYIKKALKYPSQARRMGVEGKVYVQFVVDKDGSLNEIKVIKGIGAGCDEEASRVIQEAAKWKAGKQRGRAVKQRIVMPISFKLG
jgi:protein TonB